MLTRSSSSQKIYYPVIKHGWFEHPQRTKPPFIDLWIDFHDWLDHLVQSNFTELNLHLSSWKKVYFFGISHGFSRFPHGFPPFFSGFQVIATSYGPTAFGSWVSAWPVLGAGPCRCHDTLRRPGFSVAMDGIRTGLVINMYTVYD